MNPTLRKAAILVSALDSSAADQLLDQMGEQQAARVRNAVMELHDIDPVEQDAILAEFFGHPEEDRFNDSGVELTLSAAHAASPASSVSIHDSPPPRFQFLHDANSDDLARRLHDEHPQLIALVVSHLPAEKAADMLRCLPDILRTEVIDRLDDLDDTDPDVIAELEHALERMFSGSKRIRPRGGPRQDHVQAILGHLRNRSQLESAVSATPRLNDTTDVPSRISQVSKRRSGTVDSAVSEVAISFEQLQSLSVVDFFAVFDEADPRVVLLALAGAPRRLFERYLAQFSNDRAIEFERHVEQLRPLRLRDVEAAQQELATLAGRRLQAAKTAAESSRRFAAAA